MSVAYFGNIRLLTGQMQQGGKAHNREKREIPYLFLQLPSYPGFLIEYHDQEKYMTMHRATKVNPILNSQDDSLVRPEIFVLKSDELEQFQFLDGSFVRTKNSDKTLSVPQMSEMLLLLCESVRE